jgi:IS605 OrfB family transposase
MATLTYVKGLPTPVEELNTMGLTEFEVFLTVYSQVFHKAACETANHLLITKDFNKSKWNTYLQTTYGISKRHANGVISHASGAVDAAKEHRKLHIKTLEGKLKSINSWIAKSEKKLADSQKFYRKANWQKSKSGCRLPLSCSIEYRRTNWQNLRFQIHNKKRRAYHLTKQIEHLQIASIYVSIPRNNVFVVGSKDETFGNQVVQWDGNIITFRVPACLESKFGKYVQTKLGNFDRNINRLPQDGSKTWHFYRKDGKWNAAVQFTPAPVNRVSSHISWGCIGIDMNPGSIGWGGFFLDKGGQASTNNVVYIFGSSKQACPPLSIVGAAAYVDHDGNLKAHGQIPLQMGLPRGKQDAQIVDACLQLATLAETFICPIVCEDLDFTAKKEQLSERGRKYARMLSSWAYSRFYDLLNRILINRGINLFKVNPAFTSVIGLVKYARQYGLGSDEAAAMAIARRGMRLSEKIPTTMQAYLSVKDGKHIWSWWRQLNILLKSRTDIKNRHSYYSTSNWGLVVKEPEPKGKGTKPKGASN